MANWRPYSMVKAVDIEISSVSTALLFRQGIRIIPCFFCNYVVEGSTSSTRDNNIRCATTDSIVSFLNIYFFFISH